MKSTMMAGAVLATILAGSAFAQSGTPIKLANVAELSGGGATVRAVVAGTTPDTAPDVARAAGRTTVTLPEIGLFEVLVLA